MSATAKQAATILLCAGKGTRMGDDSKNKVCFDCAGVPVIRRIVANMRAGGVSRFVVVVGHRAESVMAALDGEPGVIYAYQREQRGTGHAAACGLRALADIGYTGPVIVSMGDKIVAPRVIADLLARAGSSQAVCAVQPIAAHPSAGHVVVADGRLYGIIEFADAALAALAGVPPAARAAKLAEIGLAPKKAAKVLALAAEREPSGRLSLCGRDFTAADVLSTPWANAAIYAFADGPSLASVLAQGGSDNAQGEIYLTDAIENFARDGGAVFYEIPDADDLLTYSTRPELRRMSRRLMRSASELLAECDGADERRAALLRTFIAAYGDRKVMLARAPGRVNLMGRHIDHRGGSLNAIAVAADTLFAVSPRDDDDTVSVADVDPGYPVGSFSISAALALGGADGTWLDYLNAPAVVAAREQSRGDWINYVKAAVLRFQKATDLPLCGMDMVCSGEVPVASGLSSSSSIVVAAAKAVVALNSLNIAERDFIELCGEGEWFVGSRGGAGDHAAIACSRAGCVTRLDFKPFAVGGTVRFSDRHAVVVANSLQQSKKSEGSRDVFNAKIAAYEVAFMLIRRNYPHRDFRELRDVAKVRPFSDIYGILKTIPETVTRAEAAALLPESGKRLAEIFSTHADPGSYDLRGVALFGISECARSAQCPALLAAGDYVRFGNLMKRSHDGDRVGGKRYTDEVLDALSAQNTDVALECGAYGCSTERIDALSDLLNSMPGVFGSQMAGAGLGGCVVALVEKARLDDVLAKLNRDYYDALGLPHAAFACTPSAGAEVFF